MRPHYLVASGRRRHLLLAVPALLALAAVAAACGGSSSKAAASTSTTTTGTPQNAAFAAARAKFVSCLESHGVPASQATRPFGFRRGAGTSPSSPSSPSLSAPSSAPASAPSGAASTPPTTNATYAAAFAACRSDLPAGPGRGGAFLNTAAGRAYLQCLQLHGVTVPSTTVPGRGLGALADQPAFQKARVACAALAPNRQGDGTPVSTSLPGAA